MFFVANAFGVTAYRLGSPDPVRSFTVRYQPGYPGVRIVAIEPSSGPVIATPAYQRNAMMMVLQQFDASGNLRASHEIPGQGTFTQLSDNTALFLDVEHNIAKIIDFAGNVLRSARIYRPIASQVVDDGEMYVLAADGLHVFDETLEQRYAVAITGGSGIWADAGRIYVAIRDKRGDSNIFTVEISNHKLRLEPFIRGLGAVTGMAFLAGKVFIAQGDCASKSSNIVIYQGNMPVRTIARRRPEIVVLSTGQGVVAAAGDPCEGLINASTNGDVTVYDADGNELYEISKGISQPLAIVFTRGATK